MSTTNSGCGVKITTLCNRPAFHAGEHRHEDAIDIDFWATVARDEHGFVRTQEEWDTVTEYARGLAARVQQLEAALHAIAGPDELLDANEGAFNIHAARRMQEQARAALGPTRRDA